MKALTICQPYASLIIGWEGMPEEIRKRVENRTWNCHYRGPLLIHAGKSTKWFRTWDGVQPPETPLGFILGQVDVVDCVSRTGRDYRFSQATRQRFTWLENHIHASGPFCMILENPVR